jgi:Uma2 family endonuclease
MNIRTKPPLRTIADLLHQLGDIPPGRVRFDPVPGTATIKDLLKSDNEGCELVEGTLVEKPVGMEESWLAMWLGKLLIDFVQPRNLGIVSGEQGMLELQSGLVRGPDVTFISWGRMKGRRMPKDPIPRLAADLVVEVLSKSNTRAEMARKRDEYFAAGVRLVWEIDPRKRTVRVYTTPTRSTTLTAADTLDGGTVLPGFTLPLADLFAELDRHG